MATPRPPRIEQHELDELVDELRALIEEARRRARRRRRFSAALVAAALAAGAAALFHGGGDDITLGRSAADASPQGIGAHAATRAWAPSNGPVGGMVTSFAVGGGAVYAAALGSGVFKSTDHGGSWRAVDRGLAANRVDSIAVAPSRPTTVYAGTGDGVFRSVNGGRTWTRASSGLFAERPPDRRGHRLIEGYVFGLVVDPLKPSTVYASTYALVYRSSDAGRTWHALARFPKYTFIGAVALDPRDSSVVYVGRSYRDGGLFKSSNGGRSWQVIGLAGTRIASLVIDPLNPDTFYAATWDHGLFRSVDRGLSWQQLTGAGTSVSAVTLDPSSPGTVYVGSKRRLLKSTDRGDTWNTANAGLPSDQTPWAVAVDRGRPGTVYLSRGDGILRSTDAGTTWNRASAGLIASHVSNIAVSPDAAGTLYAATLDSGVSKSLDNGRTWQRLETDPLIRSVVVDPQRARTVYAGADTSGVLKSEDSGRTWRPANVGLTAKRVFALAFDARGGMLYAGTWGGGIFASANGGTSWRRTNVKGRTLTVVVSGETGYGGTGGGIWKSAGGRPWTRVGSIHGLVRALAIDPRDSNVVYAAASSGILKSSDGGATWHRSDDGLHGEVVQALAADPLRRDTVYIGTERRGVFRSLDGGSTWQPLNAGLPTRDIGSLTVSGDGRRLYAGTNGGGVVQLTLPG